MLITINCRHGGTLKCTRRRRPTGAVVSQLTWTDASADAIVDHLMTVEQTPVCETSPAHCVEEQPACRDEREPRLRTQDREPE